MRVDFAKYHALRNDFLVIEAGRAALSKARLSRLARLLCDRRAGVGADGILYVSSGRHGQAGLSVAQRRVDVYNADGSWAEKSGNGLRIVGLHEFLRSTSRRRSLIEMGGECGEVRILKKQGAGYMVATNLGTPDFRIRHVPVAGKGTYMVQAPLKIGGVALPVTCLSVGNPHTVLFVDNFDFDWKTLGAEIERHPAFPRRTNVEFVKVMNRKKLRVAEWERGAGATGSSGTGAAAAVAAAVISGLADRTCQVVFDPGSLFVHWNKDTDVIELSGPVEPVCSGTAQLP